MAIRKEKLVQDSPGVGRPARGRVCVPEVRLEPGGAAYRLDGSIELPYADDFSGATEQQHEHLECLMRKADLLAMATELPGPCVELEHAEAKNP